MAVLVTPWTKSCSILLYCSDCKAWIHSTLSPTLLLLFKHCPFHVIDSKSLSFLPSITHWAMVIILHVNVRTYFVQRV